MIKIKTVVQMFKSALKQARNSNNNSRFSSGFAARPEPPLGFVARTDPNFYFLARR